MGRSRPPAGHARRFRQFRARFRWLCGEAGRSESCLRHHSPRLRRLQPPTFGYDSARLANDVLAVIDSLPLERPILLGHSLGGKELTALATDHPNRVSGLNLHRLDGRPNVRLDREYRAPQAAAPAGRPATHETGSRQRTSLSRLASARLGLCDVRGRYLERFRHQTGWQRGSHENSFVACPAPESWRSKEQPIICFCPTGPTFCERFACLTIKFAKTNTEQTPRLEPRLRLGPLHMEFAGAENLS